MFVGSFEAKYTWTTACGAHFGLSRPHQNNSDSKHVRYANKYQAFTHYTVWAHRFSQPSFIHGTIPKYSLQSKIYFTFCIALTTNACRHTHTKYLVRVRRYIWLIISGKPKSGRRQNRFQRGWMRQTQSSRSTGLSCSRLVLDGSQAQKAQFAQIHCYFNMLSSLIRPSCDWTFQCTWTPWPTDSVKPPQKASGKYWTNV